MNPVDHLLSVRAGASEAPSYGDFRGHPRQPGRAALAFAWFPWGVLALGYSLIALPLIWANPYFTDDTDRLVNLPWASLGQLLWSYSGNDHWTPITFLMAHWTIRWGGVNHGLYSSLTIVFTGLTCVSLAVLLRKRWHVPPVLLPLLLALFALNALTIFSSIWTCCVLDALVAFSAGFVSLWLAWPTCTQRTWARLLGALASFNLAMYSGSAAAVFVPVLPFLAWTRWRWNSQRLALALGTVASFACFMALRAQVNLQRQTPVRELYQHLALSEFDPRTYLVWVGTSELNGLQGALVGQHSNALARRLETLSYFRPALILLGLCPGVLALWFTARRVHGPAGTWVGRFLNGIACRTDVWVAVLFFYVAAGLFYYGRPGLLPFANEPYYYVPQIAGLPLFGAVLLRHTRLRRIAAAPIGKLNAYSGLAVLALAVLVGVGTRLSGYTIHYEENFGCPTLRGGFFRDLWQLAHQLDQLRRQGQEIAPVPDLNVEESILAGQSIYVSAGCNPYSLAAYSRSLSPRVEQAGFWQPATVASATTFPLRGHPAEWFYRKYFPTLFE